MKHFYRFFYFLTTLILLTASGILFVSSVSATVAVGTTITSGATNINYIANYDYTRTDRPIFYTHTAEGIETNRLLLVKGQKLQNLPILITIPSSVFTIDPPKSEVSLEKECKFATDDTGLESQIFGECYKIHFVDGQSYENFLVLLATLPTLTQDQDKIIVEDIESLKKEYAADIQSLKGINRYYNPIWSPNSKHVAFTHWKDGEVEYEINYTDDKPPTKFSLNNGYPATQPLWSPDSKFLAVASNDEIVLFDTENKSVKRIDITPFKANMNLETLISFDPPNRLIFSFDTNLLAFYEIFTYDLSSGEIKNIASEATRPYWHDTFSPTKYLRQTRATSPNGAWNAIAEKNGSTGNVKLERLAGISTDSVSIPANGIKAEPTPTPVVGKSTQYLVLIAIALVAIAGVTTVIFIIFNNKKKAQPQTNKALEKEDRPDNQTKTS